MRVTFAAATADSERGDDGVVEGASLGQGRPRIFVIEGVIADDVAHGEVTAGRGACPGELGIRIENNSVGNRCGVFRGGSVWKFANAYAVNPHE